MIRIQRINSHINNSRKSSLKISHTSATRGTYQRSKPVAMPITPTVGAEVSGVDFSKPLDYSTLEVLDQFIQQHKVLMFRDQKRMNTEDQLRLVRGFNKLWGLGIQSEQQKINYDDGAFVIRMLPSKAGTKNVWQVASKAAINASEVSPPLNPSVKIRKIASSAKPVFYNSWLFAPNLKRQPPRNIDSGMYYYRFGGGSGQWIREGHETTNSSNVWHSDDNYVLEPPWITTLRAIELPSVGGDTVFADMTQAYEALAESTQAKLCKLFAVSDWSQGFPHYKMAAEASGDFESYNQMCELYPPVAHPVIRTHPQTGRRAIYVNSIYTKYIHKDDNLTESEGLLRDLLTLPGIPEFQARFRWKTPGDFIIWDNRVLQHYAVSDYGSARRKMEHIASLGTKPFFLNGNGQKVESKFVERE